MNEEQRFGAFYRIPKDNTFTIILQVFTSTSKTAALKHARKQQVNQDCKEPGYFKRFDGMAEPDQIDGWLKNSPHAVYN